MKHLGETELRAQIPAKACQPMENDLHPHHFWGENSQKNHKLSKRCPRILLKQQKSSKYQNKKEFNFHPHQFSTSNSRVFDKPCVIAYGLLPLLCFKAGTTDQSVRLRAVSEYSRAYAHSSNLSFFYKQQIFSSKYPLPFQEQQSCHHDCLNEQILVEFCFVLMAKKPFMNGLIILQILM